MQHPSILYWQAYILLLVWYYVHHCMFIFIVYVYLLSQMTIDECILHIMVLRV